MTRAVTTARISEKLPTLDDAGIEAVAEFVGDVAANGDLPRPLTERELVLIEQSKADFKAGRTFSPDEVRAYIDVGLARRREQRRKARDRPELRKGRKNSAQVFHCHRASRSFSRPSEIGSPDEVWAARTMRRSGLYTSRLHPKRVKVPDLHFPSGFALGRSVRETGQ